jgi:3-(3-hydroxy-phenyl)propionate hydroxylase
VNKEKRVIIVGAGPVGIVTALALARHGVPVTVFDREPGPVMDQRAASIHPTTLTMLDSLGVASKLIERGLVSNTYQYRDRVSGKLIAQFDLNELSDVFKFPFVLQYEQYKITRDITAEYAKGTDFDVRFSHKVSDIEQATDHVDVTVEGPDGFAKHRCGYVIGCDGGRSRVRTILDIPFEGFTYDENFVKIATPFDFRKAHPDYAYRNYFSDPDEWCNLFKVRGEDDSGLWRAIFPTRKDESSDYAISPKGLQERLQKFFPKDGDYEIAYANVYGVSQRVAKTFRQGRVLLAGDSAHVNNPIGGMGMNGGMHDGFNLVEKLVAVIRGADPSLLDRYTRQRRHAAVTYVQTQTIANKKMLEEKDESARRQKFAEMERIANDRSLARQFMLRASLAESLRTANEVE